MKYNSLWILTGALTLLAYSGSASAERISTKEAGRVANSFIASHAAKYRKAPAAAIATPVYAPTAKGETLLYVFNNPDNAGFTIVSGDDTLPLVIGYSTSGSFDYDSIPPSMKWWLEGMEKEIAHYYKGNTPARIINKGEEHDPVETLMTTTWNQDSPYNDLCPMDGYYRSYTGCVATAMAQVMKYHAWPPTGRGSENGIDFSDYTYDYSQMLDNYYGSSTARQRTEVATLMLHAGYASKMSYSASGSGATDANMHRALMDNFRYNPGTRLNFRDYTTAQKWDELIYGEVAAKRPVIMTGYANGGGHCFVVDGYISDGFFHLNWGWGGYQDGGYLLYLLNPDSGGAGSFDGGYNSGQTAISCMWPEGENDTPRQSGLKCEYEMSYDAVSGNINFNGSGIIYNPYGVVQSGVVGLAFEDATNPENVTDFDLMEFEDLEPYYGWRGLPFGMPDDLPDGVYKVYPYTVCTATGERVRTIFPSNRMQYMIGEVKDGVFSTENTTSLGSKYVVSRVSGLRDQMGGYPAIFSIEILNVESEPVRDNFHFEIVDAEGNVVSADNMAKSIDPESTDNLIFWGKEILETGDYTLQIYSDNCETIYKFPFTAASNDDDTYRESPIIVNRISTNSFNTDEDVTFNMTLQNVATTSTVTPVVYFLDENMREKGRVELKQSKVFSKRTLTVNVEFGRLNVKAGRYFIVAKSEGKNISPAIPLYIYDYDEIPGELAFVVTDAEKRSIRLAQPDNGEYAETIDIDRLIDGRYTLEALDGDALTFASAVEHVVLPSTVTTIGSGALYHTALSSLTFTSETAPTLMPDVIKADDVAATAIFLPDGTANTYGRAEGWQQMDLPNWTFYTADGISVAGLDKDDKGDVPAPYFTDSDDTLTLTLTGDSKIYLHLFLPDGSAETIEVTGGSATLPTIAHGNAICEISYSPTSGIESILTTENSDVYSLDGTLIKRAATTADLLNLPKGIYIVGGKKYIR